MAYVLKMYWEFPSMNFTPVKLPGSSCGLHISFTAVKLL
jgi:hypothetical protein